MSDYWKIDKLLNLNCFRDFMSRNRYMLITRALHFSRNPDPDDPKPSRLYKIDPVLECFNNRMLEVYKPSKQLSLDKSMVLWRGRLVFRQYIKNKRHKYGIKLYMLTEPNGLVLNILIYSGQGTDSTPEQTHTEYVVYKLMENYLDKGHSLFMDNYYNSSNLAQSLLQRKTYCTGTLRNNRKNNPKEIISKKLKTGESVCKYTKYGVCIVKWKDKREVLAISSEFKNEMIEVHNKYGESKLKPLPISEYNKFMSGIDRQDQMMSYYPCERKTLRWYKKIGFHFLQITLVNSYLLYCKNVKKISYYDFRLSVINSLLYPNKDTISDSIQPPYSRLPQKHFPIKVDKNHKRRYIRKRCRICATKGKRVETIYYCNKCEDQPGLCLELCFEEYHSKM
ncbi:hypothetical protein AGLY_002083 [Aphis glycines]|uniref:PiggyBac transposable element-derived protein domain-containing protein n=1 Tax=Aphis glycines TaxID=307491 RepID=A0A6G0U404_APHGL|nr:hypothetical protein AGLY_002083 [Aphis glycines]